jgi:hypothetical protein
MGSEYRLTFSDPAWYSANVDHIADRLRSVPRFTTEAAGHEYRFKDVTVENSWSYDLRIFLRPQAIDIEVSSPTASFHSDFRSIYDWIRRETSAQLVDDDGTPLWEDSS